ncbi:hypothetical protein EPN16_03655, partial [bacterium]
MKKTSADGSSGSSSPVTPHPALITILWIGAARIVRRMLKSRPATGMFIEQMVMAGLAGTWIALVFTGSWNWHLGIGIGLSAYFAVILGSTPWKSFPVFFRYQMAKELRDTLAAWAQAFRINVINSEGRLSAEETVNQLDKFIEILIREEYRLKEIYDEYINQSQESLKQAALLLAISERRLNNIKQGLEELELKASSGQPGHNGKSGSSSPLKRAQPSISSNPDDEKTREALRKELDVTFAMARDIGWSIPNPDKLSGLNREIDTFNNKQRILPVLPYRHHIDLTVWAKRKLAFGGLVPGSSYKFLASVEPGIGLVIILEDLEKGIRHPFNVMDYVKSEQPQEQAYIPAKKINSKPKGKVPQVEVETALPLPALEDIADLYSKIPTIAHADQVNAFVVDFKNKIYDELNDNDHYVVFAFGRIENRKSGRFWVMQITNYVNNQKLLLYFHSR